MAQTLGETSNLTIPPAEWLAKLFEYECCAECGGDAEDHTAIPFLGNWFARCDAAKAEAYQAEGCAP